jgi:dihydropteroate synthase
MFSLNCNGRQLLINKPIVMGIINVTPDSFYSDSRMQLNDDILRQTEKMIRDGATIIDIGGQSTRPGSQKITATEELKRVIEPIEKIRQHFPEVFISVDTYYADVAVAAVAAGAGIINDISAGTLDEKMIDTVSLLNAAYVLMHMQGTPQTMQQNPYYENVCKEVLGFFNTQKKKLSEKGITDIIIDPGFGFGKTAAHNFELLNSLNQFTSFGAPLLLGISRKSMIWKTLGITAGEAINGTTVLNTIGLMKGAFILRVHDVKEAAEAITLFANLS